MIVQEKFSYKAAGIDRDAREKLRQAAGRLLSKQHYAFGRPLELPFGRVYPTGKNLRQFFDFQIEGVGTKTLLAELAQDYSTIGTDGVAMVANDLARSGAQTLLISDAIHIAKSNSDIIGKILEGVEAGVQLSGATLASGETGDVSEILHEGERSNMTSLPFDLIVSGFGLLDHRNVIWGSTSPGDQIIGIQSSGIHSNGVTLARKILLKNWGGYFDPYDIPDNFDQPLIKELLIPTRIYAKMIPVIGKKIKLKATMHVTGDGFAKFSRLAEFHTVKRRRTKAFTQKRVGFEFANLGEMPPIFKLIQNTAKKLGKDIPLQEMFRTFNMGYGFAIIVSTEDSEDALQLLSKYFPSKIIGRISNRPGVIINHYESSKKIIV